MSIGMEYAMTVLTIMMVVGAFILMLKDGE